MILFKPHMYKGEMDINELLKYDGFMAKNEKLSIDNIYILKYRVRIYYD